MQTVRVIKTLKSKTKLSKNIKKSDNVIMIENSY